MSQTIPDLSSIFGRKTNADDNHSLNLQGLLFNTSRNYKKEKIFERQCKYLHIGYSPVHIIICKKKLKE